MMDIERVCCMCGDVGFPDKIFRCINCHHRFQHSYCSNYYRSSESSSSELPERCDWCQTEVIQATKPGRCSKKSSSKTDRPSGYSGSKIKQVHDHHRGEGSEKGKLPACSAGAPSPKTSTRRYKLLKDVMC
ncbi:hypothetical protein SSX86_027368 [Deinandra increscens subsp. villosa]|uniref:PHD-type zinc finger plants domain-containing protein n=1 Tax=Deinandra increscens subsp. villosa TaxID=3103831 RepID=A0AAP0GN18_9ASTR